VAGVVVYYVGRARGWIATPSKTRPETETPGGDL
jgi:hypothetical protein